MRSSIKIWIILILVIVGVVVLAIQFHHWGKGKKALTLISPNGGEVWQAGKEYQIKWKSRGIKKVSIALNRGKESKWIAKDIDARKQSYKWKVFVWQAPEEDYRISVVESPLNENSIVDYSDEDFTIIGPQFASCATVSIKREWPYLPSDYPGLRRIFVTKGRWSGNLGGLEGADKICQREADRRELKGEWKAFLGDDHISALDRLDLKGIIVAADVGARLPKGKTCHRFLAKDFSEFLKILSSEPKILLQERWGEELAGLSDIWIGRLNSSSKRDCAHITGERYRYSQERKNYSFTVTCENWTSSIELISSSLPNLPQCYTPAGNTIDAIGMAALASGFNGSRATDKFSFSVPKRCSYSQRLLCVEQNKENATK